MYVGRVIIRTCIRSLEFTISIKLYMYVVTCVVDYLLIRSCMYSCSNIVPLMIRSKDGSIVNS